MQQEADVFEQVESPCCCRPLVHLLLVLGLMRVDTFEDAQSPKKREISELVICDMAAVWMSHQP